MPKFILPTFAATIMGAGALFSSACSTSKGAETRTATAADTVPTVAVAQVATENLAHSLVLTAEFKPYQDIDVMAKVAGYIKEIKVDAGDRVSQGQLLATLEVPEMDDDLRRANAAADRSQADVRRAADELRRAQSARDIAKLSYDRLAGVAVKKKGLIAPQEIDDAQSRYLMADAQVSAAQSALAATNEQVRVNAADVQKIRTLMDYTRVTAPFAGVITKRYADTGSMIQAGTASQTQAMPVVRLSENTRLRLILPVPESVVPTVHIGQQVEVRVPTLNRSFPGTVARFANKLSLTTRTMDTEVDVLNPSLVIIPGMYAEVDLTLARRQAVLAVPLMAVDRDGETGGRVMVITPNNRVDWRRITLGLETANRVEVRSGLNEGDLAVLTGRPGLQPGEEVRPKITTLAADAGAGVK